MPKIRQSTAVRQAAVTTVSGSTYTPLNPVKGEESQWRSVSASGNIMGRDT